MNDMHRLFTLLPSLFLLLNPALHAQTSSVEDSLRSRLQLLLSTPAPGTDSNRMKQDTDIFNTLENLVVFYWKKEPDTALVYADRAMAQGRKMGFKKGMAEVHNMMGVVYRNKADYINAITHFDSASMLAMEVDFKRLAAMVAANTGAIHRLKGNYPDALRLYLQSMKINEEIDNKSGIALSHLNCGVIYQSMKNYDDALESYRAGLRIQEELGDSLAIAKSYNNIGLVYFDQGKYKEALDNYQLAFQLKAKLGDQESLANTYLNIGSVYEAMDQPDEALKNFEASRNIYEELGFMDGASSAYIAMGNMAIANQRYGLAESWLKKGLDFAQQSETLENIRDGHQAFATLDSLRGNFKGAFGHYQQFISARDSLINLDNANKILEQQFQYDYEKKTAATQAEQAIKDAVAKKELQKQKLVRNGFVGGFAVVLVFAGIFLLQRNRIKSAKQRSEELLLNILPHEVAEELKANGKYEARHFDDATILFTDFVSFTEIAEKLSPVELVSEIDTCIREFDAIITRHGLEKIKTIGDSYMAVAGVPIAQSDHALKTVEAALDIRDYITEHLARNRAAGKTAFEIRIGIHSGPAVAGIVGAKKFQYDIWGDTVNTASRMETNSEAGRIHVSQAVYTLIHQMPGLQCISRGKMMIKGKGEMETYFVERNVHSQLSS